MYPPTIAAADPERLAYLMVGSGERLTYGELDRRSNALAHLLRARGVSAGHTLVLLMPNSIAWPVAVAAGMRSGLLVTPVNWHLGARELAPILREAAPAAVVTTVELAAAVTCALGARAPRVVLTTGGEAGGTDDLQTALDGYPEGPIADELLGARVLFSGGSTGRPKAYRQPLLGVHPLHAPARHPGLARVLGIAGGIRLLSPAPNYHAAPFTFQLMTLSVGGTVVCMERFDASGALRALRDLDITHSQWVPTMLTRMIRVPDAEHYPLGVRHAVAVTSGGPCPIDLKDSVNDWWGDILHEYYGASEGYGHTYISPAESRQRPGSVGRPLGAARVRVLDPEGGELAAQQIGRVCFEALAPDGAITLKGMGDRGYMDADGYLYLVGREPFMIISGGVNIYPEEIEQILAHHPAVRDVAVFGAPHPDLGEQVVALVELEPNAGADEPALRAELTAFSRDHLAGYKAPRRLEFVARLPRLPTGKLNKAALRSAFLARQ